MTPLRLLLIGSGFGLLSVLALYKQHVPADENYIIATDDQPVGLIPTQCWHQEEDDWPVSECYFMQVPVNHSDRTGPHIQFPVVIFRSPTPDKSKNPVLHLGGGGPGGPLYLDSSESVKALWLDHKRFSLDLGRDIFFIDPRGTGLSKPLLNCRIFVENVTDRLQRNLSAEEDYKEIDRDYLQCISDFRDQGVQLGQFNSLAIATDSDLLRRSANVEQWVLFGVSYAAVYAQIVAHKYPETVEALILDSPAFPNIKQDYNFIENTLSSYEALYDYCEKSEECHKPITDVKTRLWSLYDQLTKAPISVVTEHPNEATKLTIVLNGERFIETLLDSVYGEDVFYDLPDIITALERGDPEPLRPYLNDWLAYTFNLNWGDVSASAHYCIENAPFTDYDAIRSQLHELPEGQIRHSAELWLDSDDYCTEMGILEGIPEAVQQTVTDIPTLILQGAFDPITPLDTVDSQFDYFTNGVLLIYELSHDIMGTSICAEMDTAKFLQNISRPIEHYDCTRLFPESPKENSVPRDIRRPSEQDEIDAASRGVS